MRNGYRFVVISNQLGLSQKRIKLNEIKHRFEATLTAIGLPCLVLIAANDDIYHKPGFWQLLNNESSDKPIVSMSETPPDIKIQLNGKLDDSSADILFAANNNISFLTPNVLRVVSKSRLKTHYKNLSKAWEAFKWRYSRVGTHHKKRIQGLGRI